MSVSRPSTSALTLSVFASAAVIKLVNLRSLSWNFFWISPSSWDSSCFTRPVSIAAFSTALSMLIRWSLLARIEYSFTSSSWRRSEIAYFTKRSTEFWTAQLMLFQVSGKIRRRSPNPSSSSEARTAGILWIRASLSDREAPAPAITGAASIFFSVFFYPARFIYILFR